MPKIKEVVDNCNQECTCSTQAGQFACLILCTILGYISSFFDSGQVCTLLVLHLGHLLSTHVIKPDSKLATLAVFISKPFANSLYDSSFVITINSEMKHNLSTASESD